MTNTSTGSVVYIDITKMKINYTEVANDFLDKDDYLEWFNRVKSFHGLRCVVLDVGSYDDTQLFPLEDRPDTNNQTQFNWTTAALTNEKPEPLFERVTDQVALDQIVDYLRAWNEDGDAAEWIGEIENTVKATGRVL